jgi:hypothetical protein
LAEVGEILLIVVVIAGIGMICILDGFLILLIVGSHRHYAQLRRRGLPLPPRTRSFKDLGFGIFFLFFAVVAAAMGLSVEDRPLWLNLLMTVPVVGLFGSLAWLAIFGRDESNLPETMAYFDFFGRMSEKALGDMKGPLALAANVLHGNIGSLKGEFTVITAAGDDRTVLPRGRDSLYPHYVALVANREPVGLFFHRGAAFPIDRGLHVRELRYKLRYGDAGRYVHPDPSEGLIARRRRLRARLGVNRLTAENVQRIIDEFTEKNSSTLPGMGQFRPYSSQLSPIRLSPLSVGRRGTAWSERPG